MKKYIKVIVLVILMVISLVLVFLSNNKDNKAKDNNNRDINIVDTQENSKKDSNNNNDGEQNINNFFNTLFNYDNENYKSRFDDIKKYSTDNVVEMLEGAGDIVTPTTSIKNKLDTIEIFFDKSEKKAIVVTNTTYTISNSANSMQQIFQIDLNEENKIEGYTVLANVNN